MRNKYIVGTCLIFCFLLASTSFINCFQAYEINKEIKEKQDSIFNNIFSKISGLNTIDLNTSSIDELTWAVLRYDNDCNSSNHGRAEMPKPDAGSVLIPGNMMTIEVCRTALSRWRRGPLRKSPPRDQRWDHSGPDRPDTGRGGRRRLFWSSSVFPCRRWPAEWAGPPKKSRKQRL